MCVKITDKIMVQNKILDDDNDNNANETGKCELRGVKGRQQVFYCCSGMRDEGAGQGETEPSSMIPLMRE